MAEEDVKFVCWVTKGSEQEIREELEKIRKIREERGWYNCGYDGFIEVWRKRFKYRGISYEIAFLKYFSFDHEDPLSAKFNGKDGYLVLEYARDLPVWSDVHYIADSVGYEDWLWADTVDLDGTLEEMEKYLHKIAKRDIDWLLDEAIKHIDKQIEDLEKKKRKIQEIIKKIKKGD